MHGGRVVLPTSVFDPFSADYLADPFSVWSEARTSNPVFYSEVLDYWVVTRYDDLRTVFGDPATFSARNAQEPLIPLCDEARQLLIDGNVTIKPLLTNNDPPDHQRVRRFMGGAFTVRAVKRLEERIEELVAERLDAFSGGRADLVDELLWDLPLLVILELLGVPRDETDLVKQWAESRLMLTWGHPSKDEQIRLTGHLVSYFNYSTDFVNRLVAEPGDDYTSDLIRARGGDDSVATLNEIAIQVFNLLIAGHETTSNQGANMFQRVLGEPAVRDALVADPDLVPNAVEESMRIAPSVISWRRQTNVDVNLGGVEIPAGANLLLVIGSGNRDETHFDDADVFRLDRDVPRDHLALGHGIHLCMGAPLARLELQTLLRRFLERYPRARLADVEPPEYSPNTSFRGPDQLWVDLA